MNVASPNARAGLVDGQPGTSDPPEGHRNQPPSVAEESSGPGLAKAILRVSAARTAFPVLLALTLGQVLFRDRGWVHEWPWTLYQLGFHTVLLGPVVAGVGAWEGVRLSAAEDFRRSGLFRYRMRSVVLTWVAAALGAGLALLAAVPVAAVMTAMSGTPGAPDCDPWSPCCRRSSCWVPRRRSDWCWGCSCAGCGPCPSPPW